MTTVAFNSKMSYLADVSNGNVTRLFCLSGTNRCTYVDAKVLLLNSQNVIPLCYYLAQILMHLHVYIVQLYVTNSSGGRVSFTESGLYSCLNSLDHHQLQ